MKSALLFLLVVVGLVGWLAPGLRSRVAATAEASSETGPSPARPEVATQNPGEVVLPRADDGHFYADVSIGGVSAHMLVDTGASVLALTSEDAEAMGIQWTADDVRPVARGAGGVILGVSVSLDQVQVGDLEAREVAAVVVPEGLAVSLLGQSFLSRVGRVEIENGQMVLGG